MSPVRYSGATWAAHYPLPPSLFQNEQEESQLLAALAAEL